MFKLKTITKEIGWTSLFVRIWSNIEALQMMWVVWELYSMVLVNAGLRLVVTNVQEKMFFEDPLSWTEKFTSILQSMAQINAEYSKTRTIEDSKNLMKFCKETDQKVDFRFTWRIPKFVQEKVYNASHYNSTCIKQSSWLSFTYRKYLEGCGVL